MNTCCVIIATFGDKEEWDKLANRAMASVVSQSRQPDEVHRVHGNSLCEARNHGAELSKTKWIIFLDADDEIEPQYIEEMMNHGGDMDLRYPRVRYVSENITNPASYPSPVIMGPKPLELGNFMCIGTALTKDLFFRAEGFKNERAYEDWSAWLRCVYLGATPRLIKNAIYRAWMRDGSRNLVRDPQILCTEILTYNRKWKESHGL